MCELTRFGRDQREITQRIDTASPITDLLSQLRGPPEGGLGLVDAAREVQRGSVDAAGGRPCLQCVVEVEGDREASRLECCGEVTRLERVDLTQGDEFSAEAAVVDGVSRGFDRLNPHARVIELADIQRDPGPRRAQPRVVKDGLGCKQIEPTGHS
jgi:hypothetical protein